MVYSVERTKAMQALRADKSVEERKADALEQIADEMHGIHAELMNLRASYQAQSRGQSSFRG